MKKLIIEKIRTTPDTPSAIHRTVRTDVPPESALKELKNVVYPWCLKHRLYPSDGAARQIEKGFFATGDGLPGWGHEGAGVRFVILRETPRPTAAQILEAVRNH